MTRNRSPFRYLPAHLMDVAQGPLALFAVVAATLVVIVWRLSTNVTGAMGDPSAFVRQVMATTLTLAVLVASGGVAGNDVGRGYYRCLLYTSPSPRDRTRSRMPSSA